MKISTSIRDIPLFFICVLMGSDVTHAGSIESVLVGRQPLAEVAILLERLSPHCGALITADFESLDSVLYKMDTCDVVVDFKRGVMATYVFHELVSSDTEIEDEVLLSRGEEDRDILANLGFDEAEMGDANTVQFAAMERNRKKGTVSGPHIMGSITFIWRYLYGVPVSGERAVVIRDHAGDVIEVTAAWQSIDPVASVEISDSLDITFEDASALTDCVVVAIESVAILGEPVDGFVMNIRICTKITYEVRGTDVLSAQESVVYVMDGRVFDPHGEW